MELVDKQFEVICGNAGALDFVRQMREALDDRNYERWLDKLIEEGVVGERLYLQRDKIVNRINAELVVA